MSGQGGYFVARCLVMDLDGTVRLSKGGHKFIKGASDVAVRPGAKEKLWEFRNAGWHVIAVSNQGGVACGFKTIPEAEAEFEATAELLDGVFHYAYQCYSHPDGVREHLSHFSLLRKPHYGMLVQAEMDAHVRAGVVIDWPNSLMVGDRDEDRDCAEAAGLSFLTPDEFFARRDDSYNVGDYLETKEGVIYRILGTGGDFLRVLGLGGPQEFEWVEGVEGEMGLADAHLHRLHDKETWENAFPDTEA